MLYKRVACIGQIYNFKSVILDYVLWKILFVSNMELLEDWVYTFVWQNSAIGINWHL